MATLYVTEYANVAAVGNSGGAAYVTGQAPLEPAIADYTVGSWPAASPTFNDKTTLVRIHTDAICSIVFGANSPSATTSNKRLAANQTEFFGVAPGMKMQVAVVTNS